VVSTEEEKIDTFPFGQTVNVAFAARPTSVDASSHASKHSAPLHASAGAS